MSLFLSSVQLGMIYAIMAFGIYISFRILQVPDLTTEGSFVFGLAVSAMCTNAGHPILALLAAMAAGAAAGCVTAFMQTKMRIHPLISGIVTMTGLYSINLLVQHKAINVSLLRVDTIFKIIPFLSKNQAKLWVPIAAALLSGAALVWFFHTHIGMCIRAVGDNEAMVRASSINTDRCKLIAFAVSNAFIALSGAVLCQYQGHSDINDGSGMLVVGLASVIIGEALFGKRGVTLGFVSSLVGSVLYRLILAYAMKYSPLEQFMLRLVSAVIVAIALSLPALRAAVEGIRLRAKGGRKNA
ncbi:MAG: ABC transporter permease [Clostridia bacterium]|nr:ABC transporter permease [Clostridia bacterium]